MISIGFITSERIRNSRQWSFESCPIRVAAEAENFGQVPHGRPPMLAIQRGGVHASSIELPLRPD